MKKILLLSILVFPFFLLSQENIKFQRYTTDDGLPANYVLKIFQDNYGFMWFGMRGGCCRFDGFNFKTFPLRTSKGNENISNWVSSFVLDNKNRLWMGEMGNYGLYLFDYENEVFIKYIDSIQFPGGLTKVSISSLLYDSKGILWLGAVNKGVYQFNPETNEIVTFNPEIDLESEQFTGVVVSLEEDKRGNIWIGSSSGLYKYNQAKKEGKFYFKNTTEKQVISSTYIDSEEQLWVAFEIGGLKKYNYEKDSFESFIHDPNDQHSLSNNKIFGICEDMQKRLWIASLNGLNIMDKKTHVFTKYYHDESDLESLNTNLLRTVFSDNTGIVWVGTAEGIAKLKTQKFTTHRYSSLKNSISQNKVQTIIEKTNTNQILIGTPVGLDLFDKASGEFSFFAGITNNNEGLLGSPLACFEEKDSGIWIGTYRGGLNYYNYQTGKYKHYLPDDEEPGSLSSNFIFSVLVDKKKNVWIGTWGTGLDLLDRKTGQFKHFNKDSNNDKSIPSENVRVVYQDSKDRIWLGTRHGVAFLEDINKGTFNTVLDNSTFNLEQNIEVCNLLETKNGQFLWVASVMGLYRYNTETKHIIRYTKENGLPSTQVFGILEDEKEHLWISTRKGLAFTSPKYTVNDTIFKCRVFQKSDGLQGNEFLPASCYKQKDGTMYFGGTSGFSMFNPDSIKDDPFAPEIAFTELKIANKKVEIGQKINGQVVLNKSLTNTKQLVLNHENNDFTIEFVALHFNQPHNNAYKYKLEGFDHEWHDVDAQNRRVDYMNLDGGNYTLRVNAANCDGLWSKEELVMPIKILPPWWKTLWFRFLVVISTAAIIIFYNRYRIAALKRQKNILEQKVTERTSELREANSQLEEKQEEIMQQNEEIIAVNNQLKAKNEEIEAQKEEIESSRDQLEKAFNNITLLSEFGQKLTATFDFDAINKMIYEYVHSLMDTAAFGIGIYNEKRDIIDFPYFMENGKPVPYFFKELSSKKSLSVRCFMNSEEILINDLSIDYKKYLIELPEVQTSELPSSVIHLPLVVENKPIGTITVNSFKKNAYKDNDVANLRTLASYISIALDNSKAYRIIRSKNEQISGSIRYGKTIQQAMLPPAEQINKYFESFILYRPKDIVSGDFYWFASIQNPLNPQDLVSDNSKNFAQNPEGLVGDKLGKPQGLKKGFYFLAVVDCTGHGVPGAFMSMIGSRLLSDIVIERKIYSPAEILEQLNIMIRKALRQDTTDNHDGMDVCLCRFHQNDEGWDLTYAGAKRPLIFYNSTTKSIEIIEGTRRSIGGVAARKNIVDFTEKTHQINEKDVFYLSTDGLVDQCNPKKRKFSQKLLIETLQKGSDYPIQEQKQQLESEIDNFQQGFEQRDDITLLGVKIFNHQ